MRFLILRSGAPPIEAMRAYEDDLRAAGVVLAADGLRPDRTAMRLRVDGNGAAMIMEGPFDRQTDVVRGFYILELRSWSEAVEWSRRCPAATGLVDGEPAEIEIREISDGPGW
jgi:hypothetical protein